MRILPLIIIIFLASSCVFGPLGTSKRALKQLEKGEFARTQKLVTKSLEKDSLLPAALYAKSRLLVSYESHEFYDSAYYFVLRAQSIYDTLEEKLKGKHHKHGFDSTAFSALKITIDSLAFERALLVNSETGYNYFLEKYPTADQKLLAQTRRNALAFASAKRQNTYQSYKEFMEKYPEAVQVAEAKSRYEKLYFDKSTSDGRVTSFIRFLEKNPETPYRKEAEQKIFEVITSEHSLGGYEMFLRKYPQSHLRQKAINYAYHVAKSSKTSLSKQWLSDSLKKAQSIEAYQLIPILEDEKYGFMSTSGEVVIKPTFKHIDPKYCCQIIADDFLSADDKLIGRNQGVISTKPYKEIADLGFGLLKINENGKWGLIHKSGERITKSRYDQVKLLENNIVALLDNNTWTLQTVSGRLLVADNFEDVYEQGGFLFFEKNELYEIKNTESLMRAVDNTPLKFDYLYSDYEILVNGDLWLKSNYGEVVINKKLEEVIPYAKQQIEVLQNGYLVNAENNTQLLDSDYKIIVDHLEKPDYNKVWMVAAIDTTTIIINLHHFKTLKPKIDSVSVLGNHFVQSHVRDSVKIYFQGGNIRTFDQTVKISLLSSNDSVEYVQVSKDKSIIFNQLGEKIIESDFEKLTPLGSEYFVFTEKGKKGLISATAGEQLLKAEYEAIGNYALGGVSLLKKQKFGFLNRGLNALIPAAYEKNIVSYNDSTFVVVSEGKSRMLMKNNEFISDHGFDKIAHWSDTVALVQQEEDWRLLNLNTNELSETAFQSYKEIESPIDERLAIILADNKYGVIGNRRGEIIPPTFNDIVVIEGGESIIFFTEKNIKEAGFFVVIYYDIKGNIIRKQAFESDEYDMIYCDQ